jgi:hypothetical protein
MHLIGPWMDFWLGMAKTFTGLETIGSNFPISRPENICWNYLPIPASILS